MQKVVPMLLGVALLVVCSSVTEPGPGCEGSRCPPTATAPWTACTPRSQRR
jgi:hypothetical protein